MKAFISYRHGDGGVTDDLLVRLKDALRLLNFKSVFRDIETIEPTTDWLAEIYKGVTEADLVVALVGTKWTAMIKERTLSLKPDILRKELSLALRLDKTVLPLLIDAAEPPAIDDLPVDLEYFARYQALRVSSSAPVNTLVDVLRSSREKAAETAREHGVLRPALGLVFTLSYVLAAWVPNAFGVVDYGVQAWNELAFIWAGFFIWPILFMPFVLMGLYDPCLTIWTRILKAHDARTRMRYASPFLFAGMAALTFTAIDATKDQAAWTLLPAASPITQAGRHNPLYDFDTDDSTAHSYGAVGDVPFWLNHKDRWPSVFFYLTIPSRDGMRGPRYSQDSEASRKTYLRLVTGGWRSGGLVHSHVFFIYVIGLFIMAYYAFLVLVILIFIATMGLPSSGNNLARRNVSVENTYLGLAYAFLAGCSWFLFRMATHMFKAEIYSHYETTDYFIDLILVGFSVLISLYVTFGLAYKFGRYRATGLSLLVLLVYGLAAFEITRLVPELLTLGFNAYGALATCCWVALFAIHPSFSPRLVRERDFIRELSAARRA